MILISLTNAIVHALSVSITDKSDLTFRWDDTLDINTSEMLGTLLLFEVQIIVGIVKFIIEVVRFRCTTTKESHFVFY